MKLYQFEHSPFCDKVRRALRHKQLPFEIEEVPMAQAPSRLRKLNPAAKVPVLEHDGRLVADSTDIALYLEDRFPDPPLLPQDPRERATCLVLEDWADESLYFYEMRLRFTLPHNAERWVPELLAHDPAPLRFVARRVVPGVVRRQLAAQGIGRKSEAQVLADVQRHLDALGGWLGDREWLVGGALSLADLAVFAQVHCLRGTEEGSRMIDARPRLGTWMDRVDRATAALQ
ncbi:MAG: glutathione S-transferase family protein [Myxococcota bacterium]